MSFFVLCNQSPEFFQFLPIHPVYSRFIINVKFLLSFKKIIYADIRVELSDLYRTFYIKYCTIFTFFFYSIL